MREQQRREYLAAMGIPVWVPRQELPFAAPSRLLPAEEEARVARQNTDDLALSARLHGQVSAMAALEEVTHVHASRTPEVAPPKPAHVPEVAEQDPAANVESVTVAPESPSEAALVSVEADQTTPRFELHFVVTGAVVWVVDDQSALDLLSRFADRVALAMQYPRATLRPVMFRWPFIENPKEDQRAAVARQALSAQWSFFEHHGGKALVGFGASAQYWAAPLSERHTVFSESLETVLATARLKRQLWLNLRHWDFTPAGE